MDSKSLACTGGWLLFGVSLKAVKHLCILVQISGIFMMLLEFSQLEFWFCMNPVSAKVV